MNASADDRLDRGTRLALVLLGLVALLGAVLIGLVVGTLFGTIFAHNSSPGPELIAAGRTAFVAPLLLVLLGIASLTCVKRKHLLIVIGLAAALLVDVVVAKWLYELGTIQNEVATHAVVTELPAPLVLQPFDIGTVATSPVPSGEAILDQFDENGVATTSLSTSPVDVAPVTIEPVAR